MCHDFALDLGAGVRRCMYCWAVEAFARPVECPERADKSKSREGATADLLHVRRGRQAHTNPA